MKLVAAHVENYRNILDSQEFAIDGVTCFVGKNESGKTALLHALTGLNPLLEDESVRIYDKTLDYPRRYLAEYSARHPDANAQVISTRWQLSAPEIDVLKSEFGPDCITEEPLIISKRYQEDASTWTLPIDEAKAIRHLVQQSGMSEEQQAACAGAATSGELLNILALPAELSPAQWALKQRLLSYRNCSVFSRALDILVPFLPKFFYFSNYDRMNGQVSIDQLLANRAGNALDGADRVFLAFLELAGISIDEIADATRYEALTAMLEAASINITRQIFQYWTQNRFLKIRVKADAGRPGDEPPFDKGVVVRARVENSLHDMSVPFSERSAGFVWFFSFLVLFSQIRKTHGDVIILLDEPGLNLHAKAQGDLLRFFRDQLEPNHQVIYTTHSPFMVPVQNLRSVRTVEDVVTLRDGMPESLGTKVAQDVLKSGRDALFPLQAALSYELSQALPANGNVLLVTGPADVLYLQAASNALKARKREALDRRWTVCPAVGVGRIEAFVGLYSSEQRTVAALIDSAAGGSDEIERLKRSQLLERGHIYLTGDFCEQAKADLEDLFEADLWLKAVNESFALKGKSALTPSKLEKADESTPRKLKKAEAHFRALPPDAAEFDRYTPASWLIRNPQAFDAAEPAIERSLARFEELFKKVNALLADA